MSAYRTQHARFREAVTAVLQIEGVDSARSEPIRPHRKLSEQFTGDDTPRPDIDGLGPWYVHTTTSEQARIGSHLDAATLAASLAGSDRRPAVIVYRRGAPISEAYAVMSLETLAGVLARDLERERVDA